ncbi:IPTL-CTERM sorting domain-containing protein [Lampropedia puyangensis]|uniref:IPTL-CTERM sorting domain-containing protein n=1 Tax=Lampropedia puyangensis TaxID=1330072 RepID=A0A4V4GR79_9BURK|nr:IPTL-CTERM sorting domain-containing protein [Lampropedia puyangensis]THU00666.1 IPTL-CTERM sorting domain-containing protein [Lampropedia puyangensis]
MKHTLKLIPAALLAFSMTAHASVELVIQQVGADVVVRGSGSLTTGNMCMPHSGENAPRSINSKDANTDLPFAIVLQPLMLLFNASLFSAPEAYLQCQYSVTQKRGTGISSEAEISEEFSEGVSEGDLFGLFENPNQSENDQLSIILPPNYSSGSPLQFSGVIANKTLQDLGLTVGGSYSWTLSTEPVEQPSPTRLKAAGTELVSIVVQAAAAPNTATPVPALGAFGLMGLAGAIGAAGVAMHRRRKR